jgi:hypothetical protein
MAEAYKDSKFYGIDASAGFPEVVKTNNIEFAIGNLAKNIHFADNYFDYIFQRLLVLGFRDEDWDNVC